MRALLIGGTGPTGPHIAAGLAQRGAEVTILHRGEHEIDEVAEYEHLHADPHFAEDVEEALSSRRFDIAIVTYGRLRHLLPIVASRADRIVSVGGTVYARQRLTRAFTEEAPRDTPTTLIKRIVETENAIFAEADERGVALTHIRYPYLYGPRQLAPREWSIIRRILDGRRTLPIIDGGLSREARAYAANAAHGVLLAVDHEQSAGRIYHIADETTPTDAERARAIAAVMGVELQLVNYPRELPAAGSFWFAARTIGASEAEYPVTDHTELDLSRARRELGYTDLVGYDEAIQETVEWYLAHPLERGGADEMRLGDPFDYEGEDRYHRALQEFASSLRRVPIRSTQVRHAYDHPSSRVAQPVEGTRS